MCVHFVCVCVFSLSLSLFFIGNNMLFNIYFVCKQLNLLANGNPNTHSHTTPRNNKRKIIPIVYDAIQYDMPIENGIFKYNLNKCWLPLFFFSLFSFSLHLFSIRPVYPFLFCILSFPKHTCVLSAIFEHFFDEKKFFFFFVFISLFEWCVEIYRIQF